MLGSRGAALVCAPSVKRTTAPGQPFEERCGAPVITKLLSVMAYAVQNGLKSHRIGVKHGPAAVTRKAEAVDVNNVDVAWSQSETLIQNVRAFIGEGGHDARDDLVIRNGALLDAAFGCGFLR